MRAYAVSNGYLTLLSDRERLTGAERSAPNLASGFKGHPGYPRPRSARQVCAMSTSDASARLAVSHGGETRRAAQEASRAPLADSLGPRLGPTATFATTEHFNLQTARALTVSEANGRASIYLAALSGNLIALAFVGQMSRLGAAFYAFALILLPVLAFVGVVTFLRLVQCSTEDLAYARRIALLRSFYLRLSPELEPYLVVVTEARPPKAPSPGAWQLTLTAAGLVAVINSVVIGACAGLVLEAADIHSLAIPVALGAVIGAAAFTLHERHHRRARDTYSPATVDLAAISVPPSQERQPR